MTVACQGGHTSNQTFAGILTGSYPAVMALTWGVVGVRDVARAHVAAMDPAVAAGRCLCVRCNIDMARVVAVMREAGFGRAKLPKLKLTGPVGTAMMRLASYTQAAGVGSYLRTHPGRVPPCDTSKIRDGMDITFRPPEDCLKATLADLVRWGHIPAPQS